MGIGEQGEFATGACLQSFDQTGTRDEIRSWLGDEEFGGEQLFHRLPGNCTQDEVLQEHHD